MRPDPGPPARVDTGALDRALKRWNAHYGAHDEGLAIDGKTITADALLTQRKLANDLPEHNAHYVFTVKRNLPTLCEAICLIFEERGPPDLSEPNTLAHGRIERRSIWTTTRLNDYLDFPGFGQVFAIERPTLNKKTAKTSTDIVYGITDHTPETANAEAVLRFNRDHWTVENGCHYILDWNWDEDRCTIRTGHGPENITALRRFASVPSSPSPAIPLPPRSRGWRVTSASSSTICA